jgi:hypothetical protein
MFRAVALFTAVLALMLVSSVAYATPVTVINGGFETGDLFGWTVTGSTTFFYPTAGAAHSGNYGLDAGTVGSITYISQVIPTVVGTQYDLSYWLANTARASDGAVTPNYFDVYAGTNDFGWQIPVVLPYTQFHLSFQAASSTTTIGFGIQQNPAYMYLDDISVNSDGQTPEPATYAQIGLGHVGLGLLRRRAQK